LIGALAAAPYGLLALEIGPPWPEGVRIAIWTAVVEVTFCAITYYFLHRGISSRTRDWVFLATTIATVITGLAYLRLSNGYFKTCREDRVVVGYELLPPVARLVGRPAPPAEALLFNYNCELEKIWTGESIQNMRYLGVSLWLLLVALTTVLLSAFVIGDSTRAAPARAPRTKTTERE
jgi:hypothetical protein